MRHPLFRSLLASPLAYNPKHARERNTMGKIGKNPRRIEVVPKERPVRHAPSEPTPAPAPVPQREPAPAR